VILTAVGSPIVARKMMESGAIIGGEDNGGTIFGDHQFCRDGAMAIVRMLELIAKHGNLDGQVDALPKYHTIKAVMHCNNRLKTEMLNELRKKIFEGNINTVDGIRVDYNDGWVIMRPSGTEPKFRITSESTDQNIAKERSERFVSLYETIYSKLEVSL
jgi:phosphomannomutase/phosphoglucomutase